MALFNLQRAEQAFGGETVSTAGGTVQFTVENIGHLVLRGEGGFFRRLFGVTQIVAADPWVAAIQGGPFTELVPAGRHPLSVAYANLPNGDRRIAFLRVQFSQRHVVGWRHAVTEDDAARLRRGESVGYGVDSGFGCLMSLSAAANLKRRVADEEDGLEREILDAMEPTATEGAATWAVFNPSPDSPENVAAVVSGFGDGVYQSYFGIDDRDVIACLVTDFKVVERMPVFSGDSLALLKRLAAKLPGTG